MYAFPGETWEREMTELRQYLKQPFDQLRANGCFNN